MFFKVWNWRNKAPSQLWPSPRKPCGQWQPLNWVSCFYEKEWFWSNQKKKYRIIENRWRKHKKGINHWTEQAEKVNPFLVSDQQPPLLIVHLAGPKAVSRWEKVSSHWIGKIAQSHIVEVQISCNCNILPSFKPPAHSQGEKQWRKKQKGSLVT